MAFPRFLAIEMWSPDTTEVTSLQPSPARLQDRECLAASLASIARDGGVKAPLALQIHESLSDPNADWKRLLVDSVFSKGTHVWMDEREWLVGLIRPSPCRWSRHPDEFFKARLPAEMEAFLEKNGQRLGKDNVLEIRSQLS